MGVFHDGKVGKLSWTDDNQDAETLGYDLVSDDPERMQGALEKLAEREISPDEVIAKAYSAVAKQLDMHDRQIADIERRRRRLRNDFDRLKGLRARPIEDAVLLDDK